MFKKGVIGFLLLIGGLLAIGGAVVFSMPAQARSDVDEFGCFTFNGVGDSDKDTIVCPDQFCSDRAYCSADGKRCYCVPHVLANSNQNNTCEVLFGSKMKYVFKNNQPEVYLYGGLWTEIAEFLFKSGFTQNIVDFEDNGVAYKTLLFKRDQGRTFRSGFINDLAKMVKDNEVSNLEIELLLDIDLTANASSAFATNQRYRVKKTNNVYECGLYMADQKLMFAKYSPVPVFSNNDQYKNPCVLPASILKLTIFGNEKVAWINTKAALSGMTRNCTDLPWSKDDEWFSQAPNWLSGVFSGYKNSHDIQVLAANMIVPQGQKRIVYFDRPDNFFMGEIIDGGDNAGAIARIKDKICRHCTETSSDKSSQCQECSNTELLDLIASSQGNFNQIIGRELTNPGGNRVCKSINRSFENIVGANKNYQPISESDEEAKVNKTLANGLTYICENANLNSSDRLKCKQNALTCYRQSLNESAPKTSCENLVGELDSSRWLICPALNTGATASDQAQHWLLNIVKKSGSATFFDDQNFNNAWQFFRNVANGLLVIVIILMIVSYITGLGAKKYRIKTILPRLLIVALLINLSIIVSKLLIDVSNITGDGIYKFLIELRLPGEEETFMNVIGSVVSTTAGTIGLAAGVLLLGAIGMLIPAVLIAILGLFFVLVLLAMRQALLILLVLFMPIAIISLLSPFSEKLFDFWRRNFVNVLLVYPIICLLVGAGTLLKYLLLEIGGGTILRLLAVIMPFATTCLAPLALTKTVNGIELLKDKINALGRFGTRQAQQIGKESTLNTRIASNLRHAAGSRFFDNQLTRRMLANRTFNQVTTNMGQRILRQRLSEEARNQQAYGQIVGEDRELLTAFINGDQTSLDNAQRQKFKQLTNLGARKDRQFYLSGLMTMARNGFADQELMQQIVVGGERNGLDKSQISNQMLGASAIARKSGHISTAALFAYNSDLSENTQPLSEVMSQPINHGDLLKKTKEVVQKVSVTTLSASNFDPNNLIATDQNLTPSQSIVNQAIEEMVQTDLGRITNTNVLGSNQPSLNGTFTESLGKNFDYMNLETQQAIGQILVNTANNYYQTSTGSDSQPFANTRDAIKYLKIGGRQ